MARYFFHVRDNKNLPDKVGHELPDLAAARKFAVKYAGELLQQHEAAFEAGEDWEMEVTDECGLVLFQLQFHVFAAPASY